ncbi:hypothetical protein [aff. Roholtiella sp. LEGE 12411]|uniref:hypothetical protein n=1 Tax=aff. Roholtiella sp. LEGE 12411 TaxID=1828822 RepID=UPI0018800199|nr:hypothetical protein [aff. Roholtiella sp. LEGE 12411]MBE9038771.1 hypothetical protein [aff. Roholtiella sp. LEGE 12411]
MDDLESKILEILKRGTPLRAVKIADMLGVERREVNHYLYSSLKNMVVQDSEFKWSFKTNKIGKNQRIPTQPRKSQTQSPIPIQQDTSYSFTKKEIKQDTPNQPPTSPTPSSQPVKQTNPYEVVKTQLAQLSSREKVKILENAFRQDRFSELEDEQINALQSILEEAKREVNITNTAYTQGKLSSWKANRLAIAAVSITLAFGTFFVISQLRPSSTYQPTPTIPQNR